MPRYNQEFKVQSVEKVLSKRSDESVKTIAEDLGVVTQHSSDGYN